MSAMQQFTPTEHNNEIMKNVKLILEDEQLCDVVLIASVDGKRITAHRLILSAASVYFKAMFTGALKEAKEKEISINDIDGETLQALVSYCYNGYLNLRDDNAEKILSAAHLLRFISVVDKCAEFLKTQLSSSNCLGIQYFAEQYNCTELESHAQNYVCKNFYQVIKSEEFFKLNVNQLADFLSIDNLNVKLEEDVFHCLMSWVKRDKFNRKKYLAQLLPHIRINLMDRQFIDDNVESVCKENACLELISHANQCKHKKRSYFGNGMLLGCDDNGNFGKYCPDLNEWTLIYEMKLNRKYSGYAVWQNKLIAVGGIRVERAVRSVQYWHVEHKQWKDMAPLIKGRTFPGVTTLRGSLYAVGGDSEFVTVERLDTLSGTWTSVASLPIHLDDIQVMAFDDCIYAKGCYSYVANHLCRYDPHTNSWTLLSETDEYIKSLFVAEDELYAFRDKSLLRYNKNSNSWSTYFCNCQDVQALCIIDDRIFTVVNEYGKGSLKKFDLDQKVFTDVIDLTPNVYNMFSIKNP